ncbi:MAG: hypothetical protein FJX52_11775 [Alphaproteobacteria bacterium]|nr:hypothetical protein [Alphaproteobacteria bacterium]
MLAFHMLAASTKDEAMAIAREPLNRYLRSLVDAASAWTEGLNSADYPNYDKIIAGLAQETIDTQMAKGAAWIGTPRDIADAIADYDRKVGGFEVASLQVNFNTISFDVAARSMRLFAEQVLPKFRPGRP